MMGDGRGHKTFNPALATATSLAWPRHESSTETRQPCRSFPQEFANAGQGAKDPHHGPKDVPPGSTSLAGETPPCRSRVPYPGLTTHHHCHRIGSCDWTAGFRALRYRWQPLHQAVRYRHLQPSSPLSALGLALARANPASPRPPSTPPKRQDRETLERRQNTLTTASSVGTAPKGTY